MKYYGCHSHQLQNSIFMSESNRFYNVNKNKWQKRVQHASAHTQNANQHAIAKHKYNLQQCLAIHLHRKSTSRDNSRERCWWLVSSEVNEGVPTISVALFWLVQSKFQTIKHSTFSSNHVIYRRLGFAKVAEPSFDPPTSLSRRRFWGIFEPIGLAPNRQKCNNSAPTKFNFLFWVAVMRRTL